MSNRLFYDIAPPERKEIRPGSFKDPETGAITWTLKPERIAVSPELTLQDRRELTKTGLTDAAYFAKAKRVFAANGSRRQIWKECGRSPSYAAKVFAAFNRAKANTDKK